jgi:hypothetical protein
MKAQQWCFVSLTEDQIYQIFKKFIPTYVGWCHSKDEIEKITLCSDLSLLLTTNGSLQFTGTITALLADTTNKIYEYVSKPGIIPNCVIHERINRAAWEKTIPTHEFNEKLQDNKFVMPGAINICGNKVVYTCNFKLVAPGSDE